MEVPAQRLMFMRFFCVDRLLEMAEHRLPDVYSDAEKLYELGSKVRLYVESTCQALLHRYFTSSLCRCEHKLFFSYVFQHLKLSDTVWAHDEPVDFTVL